MTWLSETHKQLGKSQFTDLLHSLSNSCQALLPALLPVIRVKLRKSNPCYDLFTLPSTSKLQCQTNRKIYGKILVWLLAKLDSYGSHQAELCGSTQSCSVVRVTFATLQSLPWFQVFLAAWLLDAFQWTNASDFPYDAHYGHLRHLKWQLYWAHFSDYCFRSFQLSPQARSLTAIFLFACRYCVFIHVIPKTMSSHVCQFEFPASKEKNPKLRKTITCLLLLLTTWTNTILS